MTTETSIGSHPPEPAALIQLEFQESQDKRWVELPDCSGGADEIKLAANLENASVATCKERPALF
jgi:hypothetical protein